MIDGSFHRSQSDCGFVNSPLLIVLNINANFATSVLVSAHSTHSLIIRIVKQKTHDPVQVASRLVMSLKPKSKR